MELTFGYVVSGNQLSLIFRSTYPDVFLFSEIVTKMKSNLVFILLIDICN